MDAIDSSTRPPASGSAPRHREYDVVVVGGRAAGSATAMLLARAGHRVLVLDRTRRGSDTLSTHALLRGAVLQLVRWGLADEIIAAGTPVIPEVVFRYPDDDLTLAVDPVGPLAGLVAPKRTVLDRILAEAAEAAGAELCFDTPVDRLLHDETGRITGAAGRRGDERFEVTAPLTIGADGVRSSVARAVRAPTRHLGRHATGLAYAYFEGLETSGYEWCWAPGRAAGIIPTNDGHAVVFVSVPADQFRHLLAADVTSGLHRVLAEVRPDVADRVRAARLVGRTRSFPGLPGHVRTSHGPGWALVGDAGYWKDPISAHGLTDALRDAELLAGAVGRVLTGVADETEAMTAYQAARDALSMDLFRIVDEMAGLRWSVPEIKSLLVDLSGAMAAEVHHLGEALLTT